MEVKTHIVTAADKLFGQYGFKSVTMDDIAKHLGISKKTIYQHFEDKDDLVNKLMEARLHVHNDELKQYAAKGIDAVHEIFLGLDDLNEWLNTLNPRLFYDLQKYHLEAWFKFKNFKEQHLAIGISSNLRRGIEEGIYRNELNIDILTALRLSHSQIIFNQPDHHTDNQYSVAQKMIEITLHFLYGICNLKGKELIVQYHTELTDHIKN